MDQRPPKLPQQGLEVGRLISLMSQAPRVSTVVVACDPGEYLLECLESLRDSGYPNLEVVVVDNHSIVKVEEVVREILPEALVVRTQERLGYSEAANLGAAKTSEPSYILMMHDDTAILPDAIPAMLEVAFAKNAAIVTPKISVWDSPSQLLQVGADVDRTASLSSRIDVGDLDQGQYDSIDEVAVAPGGVQLIRADLFQSLEGFDEELKLFGEDIDFCWRAVSVGAKIYCAPRARARHLLVATLFKPHRSFVGRLREEEGRYRVGAGHLYRIRHTRRAQLRSILKSTTGGVRVRGVATFMLVSFIESLFYLLTGRPRLALAPVDAIGWNLTHLREISKSRKKIKTLKGDSRGGAISYVGVSTKAKAFFIARRTIKKLVVEGKIARSDRPEHLGEDELNAHYLVENTSGVRKVLDRISNIVLVLGVLAVVLPSIPVVFGSNPLIGSMAPFPSPTKLFLSFIDGSYGSKVLPASFAPTADIVLSALGFLFFGAMGILHQTILFLAELVGIYGVYSLAAKVATRSSAKVVAGIYGTLPLLAQSVHSGNFFAIIGFGAVPLLLSMHAGAADAVRLSRRVMRRSILSLGLVSALVAAFVPVIFLVYLMAIGSFLLVSIVSGERGRARRSAFVLAVVSITTIVLNIPWSLSFFYFPVGVARLFGPTSLQSLSFLSVLSFKVDSGYTVPVTYAFVVLFTLLGLTFSKAAKGAQIGRRLAVFLVLALVGLAGARGLFGGTPVPLWTVMLFGTSFLLTGLAVALDALADDLPRFSFGVRHLVAGVGTLTLVVAVLVGVAQISRPRFDMPTSGFHGVSSFVSALPPGQGVLWMGNPELLPVGSWKITDGLAVDVVGSPAPDFRALYPPPSYGSDYAIVEAVKAALLGHQVLLGHVLAQEGIRYVVLPQPTSQLDAFEGTPLDIVLERQIDMKQLLVDPTVVMYQVTQAPRSVFMSSSPTVSLERYLGVFVELLALGVILYGLSRRRSWVMNLTVESLVRNVGRLLSKPEQITPIDRNSPSAVPKDDDGSVVPKVASHLERSQADIAEQRTPTDEERGGTDGSI